MKFKGSIKHKGKVTERRQNYSLRKVGGEMEPSITLMRIGHVLYELSALLKVAHRVFV